MAIWNHVYTICNRFSLFNSLSKVDRYIQEAGISDYFEADAVRTRFLNHSGTGITPNSTDFSSGTLGLYLFSPNGSESDALINAWSPGTNDLTKIGGGFLAHDKTGVLTKTNNSLDTGIGYAASITGNHQITLGQYSGNNKQSNEYSFGARDTATQNAAFQVRNTSDVARFLGYWALVPISRSSVTDSRGMSLFTVRDSPDKQIEGWLNKDGLGSATMSVHSPPVATIKFGGQQGLGPSELLQEAIVYSGSMSAQEYYDYLYASQLYQFMVIPEGREHKLKDPEAVVWSSMVNTTADSTGSIWKSSGGTGVNAGAVSTKALNGPGYVEFEVDLNGASDALAIGLGYNNVFTNRDEIFAWVNIGPTAYQFGSYQTTYSTTHPSADGDIIRIKYDGVKLIAIISSDGGSTWSLMFDSWPMPDQLPMMVDTYMFFQDDRLNNVKLYSFDNTLIASGY